MQSGSLRMGKDPSLFNTNHTNERFIHQTQSTQKKKNGDPTTAKKVKLICQTPSIERMDSVVLGQLTECELSEAPPLHKRRT